MGGFERVVQNMRVITDTVVALVQKTMSPQGMLDSVVVASSTKTYQSVLVSRRDSLLQALCLLVRAAAAIKELLMAAMSAHEGCHIRLVAARGKGGLISPKTLDL